MSRSEKFYKSNDKKRKIFAETLEDNLGNITSTCKALRIHPTTYYEWRKKDENFAQECDLAQASVHDYVKSKLMQNIDRNDTPCIMFYLKTQCGWIEKKEILHEVSDNLPVNLNIEFVK